MCDSEVILCGEIRCQSPLEAKVSGLVKKNITRSQSELKIKDKQTAWSSGNVSHLICCAFLTFSGLVLILAELERTKKDLAALKERHAELTQEYDKLLKEYAKAQVGGEGWEMGVDLAWEQALVTCAAGHAFVRPQEGWEESRSD